MFKSVKLLKYILHFRVIYPDFCQDRTNFFAVAVRSMADGHGLFLLGKKGFLVRVCLLCRLSVEIIYFLYLLLLIRLLLLSSYLIALSSKLFLSQPMIFTFRVSNSEIHPAQQEGEAREQDMSWESFSESTELGNAIPKL